MVSLSRSGAEMCVRVCVCVCVCVCVEGGVSGAEVCVCVCVCVWRGGVGPWMVDLEWI